MKKIFIGITAFVIAYAIFGGWLFWVDFLGDGENYGLTSENVVDRPWIKLLYGLFHIIALIASIFVMGAALDENDKK